MRFRFSWRKIKNLPFKRGTCEACGKAVGIRNTGHCFRHVCLDGNKQGWTRPNELKGLTLEFED